MKRVKIFMEHENYDLLEERVNQFLESLMPEKVIDIQYQDCVNAVSVLIVYETEAAIAASDAHEFTARSFEDIYGGNR